VEIGDIFIWLFSYRTDRFLITVLCILIVFFLFNYSRIAALKQGKSLFWITCFSVVIAIGLTAGVYWRRLPHGLSGNYYANALWQDDGIELDRFFEKDGKRVDRFIDFHPNDFNSEYPFSGKPFSVRWQGSMYVPYDGYRLYARANMGTWLYVNDELVEGGHRIDFGTSAARTYLREGWSHDELWGTDRSLTFVWSAQRSSEFYLGVDEPTDYRLIFRCRPFVYEGSPQQEMAISIAGKPVGSVALKEGWHTYSVAVPRSLLQELAPGFFRVQFSYSHVIRPSEVLKQSQDTRRLAVAFDFAMLQKLPSDKSGLFTQETLPQNPSLSKGLHSVMLKALTNQGKDVFIQLIWQQQKDTLGKVIPEDFLFPETLHSEEIYHILSKERIWLGASIVYKIGVCLFLGSLAIVSLMTTLCFRKLFTWDLLGILAIGIFAFGMRVLYMLDLKSFDPHFDNLPPGLDHLTYVIYARGFLRGYWPKFLHGPFYGAPLISFSFIVCSILFGEDLLITRLVMTLIATGSVFLCFGIAKQMFNRPVAYIAAIMCACNGVLIFYDISLLIAPLLTFFSLLSLYFIGKLSKERSLKTTILLGFSLGLTALTRSNIFLFMPFLFLWMMFYFPERFLRKAGFYVLLCVVMFLTILPVTIRNFYSDEEHRLVPINENGGIMLWVGNNPHASGMAGFSSRLLAETEKRMEATGSSYVDEVFRYIKEQPLDYLKLVYKKFKLFWRGYEIGNILPYYLTRSLSKFLGLPWINFVLIGPLGVVGMALAVRKWKEYFILYSFIFIQMLTALIFIVLARYRLPVVPVLTIFAAYALWYLGQMFRAKQWRRLGLIAGAILVLYVLMNVLSAARMYQQHHGEAMPLINVLRYWDLFHTP